MFFGIATKQLLLPGYSGGGGGGGGEIPSVTTSPKISAPIDANSGDHKREINDQIVRERIGPLFLRPYSLIGIKNILKRSQLKFSFYYHKAFYFLFIDELT